VAGEMLDDDGNVVVVSAHEPSAEMNTGHWAIIYHRAAVPGAGGPRARREEALSE
jgi:hypothetical protein